MKYCSKCGKELLDEAAFCPGCGCPVDGNKNFENTSKQKKVITALVLNIFAIVVSFCSGFVYSGLTADTVGEAFNGFFRDPVVYRLFGLVAISFVLCLVAVALFKKPFRTILVWVYVASVVATVAYFAVFSPLYFFTTICGSGVLFPVAPILQVIAAVKLVQAAKE